MAMQFLLDVAHETVLEAASCVGFEVTMFAVATAAYLLLVGGGSGAAKVCKPYSMSEKQMLAGTRNSRKAKCQGQSPRGRAEQVKGSNHGTVMQTAISAIRACGRAGDMQGAVAAFEALRSSGEPLGAQAHNCLIDAYIQCKDISSALQHFREVASTGTLDVVTYNTVLKALLGIGRTADAQGLLHEMAKRGIPASRVTFHELLNAEVSTGSQRNIWKLVDQMRAAGHAPDAVTCSILAKSLKDGAHPWNVERVMNLVAEIGGPVDEVLLSSVVEACIRIQRLDMVSNVTRRFESEGNALKLSASCYGSLIKAHGQSGEVTQMWGLWNDMCQNDVKATAVTLGCMVDALVVNGSVQDAWDLVRKMHADEETRPLVNTIIYSTILKGFSQAKKLDCIFKVLAEMNTHNIPCNVITYNTMLDACARCSAMDRAPRLLDSMRKDGVEPDLVTYSSLVKGYSLCGDVRRGFKVLEEMKSSGKLMPDEIMYNSLLEGCAREQRVDEALKLLESMKAAGVAPSNYTLSTLVKLLGRARRLDEVFKLIEEFTTRHNIRLNIQVYTCLIQACFNNRRLDLAMGAHDRMFSDPSCRPDEKAYSVLVRGCLQANGLDEALHAVRCAYQLISGDDAQSGKACRRGRSVPGMEKDLLFEAVAQLRSSNQARCEAAKQLVADLKEKHGLDVDAMSGGKSTRTSIAKGSRGKAAYRGRCA